MLMLFLAGVMGILEDESENDRWRYCYYDDGQTLTVPVTELCPLRVPGR